MVDVPALLGYERPGPLVKSSWSSATTEEDQPSRSGGLPRGRVRLDYALVVLLHLDDVARLLERLVQVAVTRLERAERVEFVPLGVQVGDVHVFGEHAFGDRRFPSLVGFLEELFAGVGDRVDGVTFLLRPRLVQTVLPVLLLVSGLLGLLLKEPFGITDWPKELHHLLVPNLHVRQRPVGIRIAPVVHGRPGAPGVQLAAVRHQFVLVDPRPGQPLMVQWRVVEQVPLHLPVMRFRSASQYGFRCSVKR